MKSIIKLLIFITIFYCTFKSVSADCIRFETSGSSDKYGRSGRSGCLDFVTLNTTYTDSSGNLRHGTIEVLTSGALSNTIQNPIMILSFICAMIYFVF